MATTPLPRLSEKQTEVLTQLPEPDSSNKRQYERLTELGLVFRVGETYERKLLGDNVVEAIKAGNDSIETPDPDPEPEERPSREDDKKLRATLKNAQLSENSDLTPEQRERALKVGNRKGSTARDYILHGANNKAPEEKELDPRQESLLAIVSPLHEAATALETGDQSGYVAALEQSVAATQAALEQAQAVLA